MSLTPLTDRLRDHFKRAQRSLSLFFSLSLFLLSACLTTPAQALEDPNDALRIHFIDIGQGDSALILSPAGKVVLLDSGPSKSWNTLRDYLDRLKIKKIDLLINSHPHADHIGNAHRVIKRYQVKTVLDSGFAHPIRAYRDMLEVIQTQKVSLKLARKGRKINLGGGATLHILGPEEPFISHSRSDPNSNSVIFRLTFLGHSALFTGDAEEETEHRLLADAPSLRAGLLKVAHHGSRHASSRAFLDATRPKHAVISCSEQNRYGHPAPETLTALRQAGAQVWVTADVGSVIAINDGRGWSLSRADGRASPPTPSADTTERAVSPESGQSPNSNSDLINVNTADQATLRRLPRIGPKLADRIIKVRADGPFSSADDLQRRVKGIGAKTAAKLEPLISF